MQNLKLLSTFFIICLLCTCSVGVNKDLLTGLSYSYKGLSLEDAYLSVDNEEIKTNEIEYGKKVNIVLTGVKGYDLDDGKVDIGCKITVSDNEGNALISADDAFAASHEGGLTPDQAEMLNTSLTIGKPLAINNEYKWETLFWDKNGKGTISTEITIKVIPRSE
ncbi:MAG: hypothetical protein JSV22_14860 [Bacteroidales bacterium]|nr:MAG: hypothetical protein JSV22_14860 [Bacteroidales bacterium]